MSDRDAYDDLMARLGTALSCHCDQAIGPNPDCPQHGRPDSDVAGAYSVAAPLLARAEKAEAAVARVRALAESWGKAADDNKRWLNGPRVSVSEAQQYPATIDQARQHVAAILRALNGEQP